MYVRHEKEWKRDEKKKTTTCKRMRFKSYPTTTYCTLKCNNEIKNQTKPTTVSQGTPSWCLTRRRAAEAAAAGRAKPWGQLTVSVSPKHPLCTAKLLTKPPPPRDGEVLQVWAAIWILLKTYTLFSVSCTSYYWAQSTSSLAFLLHHVVTFDN